MSKLHRLQHEIKALVREGLVKIENDTMTIINPEKERLMGQTVEVEVHPRIMHTGPWGALLLMGALPDALKEIKGTAK